MFLCVSTCVCVFVCLCGVGWEWGSALGDGVRCGRGVGEGGGRASLFFVGGKAALIMKGHYDEQCEPTNFGINWACVFLGSELIGKIGLVPCWDLRIFGYFWAGRSYTKAEHSSAKSLHTFQRSITQETICLAFVARNIIVFLCNDIVATCYFVICYCWSLTTGHVCMCARLNKLLEKYICDRHILNTSLLQPGIVVGDVRDKVRNWN